ncbi:MAG TPA: LysR family transcriptional regulator [Labilithrix sp.]|nr:LysR family transcriptional regulator [Labilithrix sp.]
MDLNLLVAFEALYRERSVTKAGRRLGLSQPATSAALARLRFALGDELFVKTPRGFEPTARCEALASPIRAALDSLRLALGEETFDPSTTDVAFRVGAVDAVLAVILHDVAARVMIEAPHACLLLRSIDPGSAIGLLDAGDIDLAVAVVPEVPAHIGSRELFAIPLVVATRPGHPLSRKPGLAELATYPHVMVSFAGPARSSTDDAFEKALLHRHVSTVVSSFLAVPHVLARSDALAFVPAPFGRAMEASGQLRCVPLPAELALAQPNRKMRMLWPARVAHSPAWEWLRGLVREVAGPDAARARRPA